MWHSHTKDNSHPWILLRFPSLQLHLTPSLLLQPNCHNEKKNKKNQYLNVHFVYLLFCHYGTCISHASLFGKRNCFTKIRLDFLCFTFRGNVFGNSDAKKTMKSNITSFYQTSSKQMSSYSTSLNLSLISTVWMQKRRKFTVKESFDVKFTAWPPSDSTKYAYSPLLTNAKLNLIVVEIEH